MSTTPTPPNPPNIDQRLEALTHSVELIAKMQLQTEKELRRLGKYIRGIAQISLDHEARIRSMEGRNDEDDDE